VWLILISRPRLRRFFLCRQGERNKLLRGRDLRDHRPEPREKQRAYVELASLMQRNDLVADRGGIAEAERADRAQVDHFDDLASKLPAQNVMAFLADTKDLNRFALPHQRQRRLTREARDRGIESAAKTAFGGTDDQEMDAVAAAPEQRRNLA